MIRYKDLVFEDYFIDPVTAVITDKDGNVQYTYVVQGRRRFKGMQVHRIQAHTAWGYKEGYEVHHKDRNKLNNALSNLSYLSKSEHTTLHNIERYFSAETRAKIASSRKGTHCSAETRAKMSATRKGRPGPMLGKHLSDETRAKISSLAKGRRWWNNGIKNTLSKVHPGDGWVRGRLTSYVQPTPDE